MVVTLEDQITDLEEKVFTPLLVKSKPYYLIMAVLIGILGFGIFAYITQFTQGLEVTGMRDIVSWGFYMAAFVFFIGISHAGTLISAILRVTGAEWRRPITRIAEAITVFALFLGASMVLIDMGRPDRILNVIVSGKLDSPIVWDVLSITTYLSGSLIYLYIALIPDIAICRDRLPKVSFFRRLIYRTLAMGWRGTQEQKRVLNKAIGYMAVLIIPVAVSVHTVVSWIFAMTLRPGWHSAIFGPYFVTGAIFSGVAAIIIVMAILRKVYHLEEYLTEKHFNNLSLLLLAMTIVMIYMSINEFFTGLYGGELHELDVLDDKFTGSYRYLFWGMVIFGFIVPGIILSFKKGRTVTGSFIASVLIVVGMFIERFLIVIPTLSHPYLPYGEVTYIPTWVELSIFAAACAAFILMYIAFIKMFPLISIWEMKEGIEIEKEKEAEYRKPPEERDFDEEKKPIEHEEMEVLFKD
jgi:molybdopterin-containing oxidoreductase family membrane subunit